MNINEEIAAFEKANKSCVIAYGGDGTLLDIAFKNDFKKAIFPIRNYGLCEEHKDIFNELLGKSLNNRDFKQTIHPLLEVNALGFKANALAEITLKNQDITSCMRFDLFVNDKLYMENVICDGLILATSLGSHGYFKSVTRTIFSGDGIGVGFIAPTYGINNLVLNSTDKISVRFVRDSSVIMTADKRRYNAFHMCKDNKIIISRESKNNLSLFGYDVFCCPVCRRNRNSTIINDQYLG